MLGRASQLLKHFELDVLDLKLLRALRPKQPLSINLDQALRRFTQLESLGLGLGTATQATLFTETLPSLPLRHLSLHIRAVPSGTLLLSLMKGPNKVNSLIMINLEGWELIEEAHIGHALSSAEQIKNTESKWEDKETGWSVPSFWDADFQPQDATKLLQVADETGTLIGGRAKLENAVKVKNAWEEEKKRFEEAQASHST